MAVIIDYYPFSPTAMWGEKEGFNPLIVAALEAGRDRYHHHFDEFERFRDFLHYIPHSIESEHPTAPYWGQPWFSTLDAASLVCFIGALQPKQYIEIGSGNSTKFARHAVANLSPGTKITSIDPSPRVEIDAICDRVIRSNLEQCDLSLFEELRDGDILFFDGSHRVFTNSDVSCFFFKFLPRLRADVIIHIHDIFLPFDYPESWGKHYFSEQYLLAAFLMSGNRLIEPIFPNFFISTDKMGLSHRVERLFRGSPGIPLIYQNEGYTSGVSFWFRSRLHRVSMLAC